MTFAEIEAEYVRLRSVLRTFVGDTALDEITVQPPSSDDEASFLRLVAWSYVMVFEAGRVTIPYLLRLPSNSENMQMRAEDARSLIHDIRTWSFHNLGLFSERDIEISRRVTLWFNETCGANPPVDVFGWRRCFEALCTEVGLILAHCQTAVELTLSDPDDIQIMAAGLSDRLNFNWQPHRFDTLVQEAATRMGRTLNVQGFREPRLARWREYLQTVSKDDDPESMLVRLIESNLIDHFESTTPIDGNDVMDYLGISQGRAVGEALSVARRLYREGVTDRDSLLSRLAQEYGVADH